MTGEWAAALRGALFAVALLIPVAGAAQLGREAPLATPQGYIGRMAEE